jgi:hypothetical protein
MAADVGPDAALIPIPCCRLDVQHLQIAIQQVADRGVSACALRSSTWLSRRVRTVSAVAAAFGPAGTVFVRKFLRFVGKGSIPVRNVPAAARPAPSASAGPGPLSAPPADWTRRSYRPGRPRCRRSRRPLAGAVLVSAVDPHTPARSCCSRAGGLRVRLRATTGVWFAYLNPFPLFGGRDAELPCTDQACDNPGHCRRRARLRGMRQRRWTGWHPQPDIQLKQSRLRPVNRGSAPVDSPGRQDGPLGDQGHRAVLAGDLPGPGRRAAVRPGQGRLLPVHPLQPATGMWAGAGDLPAQRLLLPGRRLHRLGRGGSRAAAVLPVRAVPRRRRDGPRVRARHSEPAPPAGAAHHRAGAAGRLLRRQLGAGRGRGSLGRLPRPRSRPARRRSCRHAVHPGPAGFVGTVSAGARGGARRTGRAPSR